MGVNYYTSWLDDPTALLVSLGGASLSLFQIYRSILILNWMPAFMKRSWTYPGPPHLQTSLPHPSAYHCSQRTTFHESWSVTRQYATCTWHVHSANVSSLHVFAVLHSTPAWIHNFMLKCKTFRPTYSVYIQCPVLRTHAKTIGLL